MKVLVTGGGGFLGLALCRRIAERHDGWIRAAQRDGGGTRVEVRLPAVPTEAAAPTQQRVIKVRRDYHAWVASETLEDYALRFTPRAFRK